jgi:uncharacterized protein
MTIRALLLAVAVLGLALPRARAESTFVCGDPHKGMSDVVCADRELTRLGKAMDARFAALLAQADSLTRLLLRRDQSWFAEILGGADTAPFAGQEDPERLRLKAVLAQRLATLDAVMPRATAATPAGIWANALATLTVSPAAKPTRCGSPSRRSSPMRAAAKRSPVISKVSSRPTAAGGSPACS